MRIVFMGTPEFSVNTLEELIKYHEVVGVVTKVDKPRGRGQNIAFSEIKQVAINNNIPIYQPLKVKGNIEFINEMKSLNLDVIVVVAYGKILPKEILDLPKFGCINAHASLLPKHRGSSPINFSILKGDSKSGITTMFMDEGMDTGDMLLKAEVSIDSLMNAGQLHDKLKVISGPLIIETLKQLENGTAVRIKQNELEATYTTMLTKEMGHIDFSKSAEEILNLIRGLNPWPVAYCLYKEKKMKVYKAQKNLSNIGGLNLFENGQIIKVSEEGVFVKVLDGCILITHIQFENKKVMDIKTFLNGNTIEEIKLI